MKPIDFFSPVYFLLGGAVKQEREQGRVSSCSHQTYRAFSLSDSAVPLSQAFCRGGARGQAKMANGNPSRFQRGLWARQRKAVSSVWYGTASGRRGNALIYTFISYSHLWFRVPSSVAACSAQGHGLAEEGWNNRDTRHFFKKPTKGKQTNKSKQAHQPHTTREQPIFLPRWSCKSYSQGEDKIRSAHPQQNPRC